MHRNRSFSGLAVAIALVAASLALGVAAPVAAQTRSLPRRSLERDAFGQLTEWAAGAWRLGDQASRARLRLPEVPVFRLQHSEAQEPAET